ncbi:hypothetical protein J6524_16455 [Bradyrhizobium sp. WSM 1738]|uniref:hypothetical protein n=1 Tax=Bradyrhizobium hereditatis TaxID=2821405 RepID=UPI001CE2339D|nr:hypothetical protein [Bradyrhizobium hereditatis]MCA6116478.1 hypothetical protein [Bradyrhizobium hereditatis]
MALTVGSVRANAFFQCVVQGIVMALRWPIRMCLDASLALALISPAAAEPLRDESTGLAIDPPQGYIARVLAPTPTFVVRFEVKKPSDRDTGCQVAFTPLPQNAELKQSEINDIVEGQRWIDLARATVAINYDVSATDRFNVNGIGGIAMIGDFKPRPGLPARAQDVRTLFMLVETPKGRTTTICVGEKQDFDARRAEFENVARSASPPR